MPINKGRIKAKVDQAISNLPTTITLKRDAKVSDGYDGYTEVPETVAEFDGFLDSSKSRLGVDSITQGDFGTIKTIRKVNLLAVFDETFEIKIGDYFVVDGIKYRVSYPRNQYDIYWECECEVVV